MPMSLPFFHPNEGAKRHNKTVKPTNSQCEGDSIERLLHPNKVNYFERAAKAILSSPV